jgi:uncharacterized membrane protein YfcA
MEYLVGFAIALVVGLTGVGAGSVTAPVLMLFFGLPPIQSVGTALSFAAIIKLALFPFYVARKQVNYRILGLLCLGGIPGVIAGFWLIGVLNKKSQEGTLLTLLGLTIITIAIFNVARSVRPQKAATPGRDRTRWLPPIAAVIGGEVGFSSAGAGALGAATLLTLTTLTPAQVVGTDMLFGLATSLVGGGFHFGAGHYSGALLTKLVIGGLAGAFAGATLSNVIPSRVLRVALSVWLVIVGAQLCWRAASTPMQPVQANVRPVR